MHIKYKENKNISKFIIEDFFLSWFTQKLFQITVKGSKKDENAI